MLPHRHGGLGRVIHVFLWSRIARRGWPAPGLRQAFAGACFAGHDDEARPRFHSGGSADGRCELAMTAKPEVAETRLGFIRLLELPTWPAKISELSANGEYQLAPQMTAFADTMSFRGICEIVPRDGWRRNRAGV